MIFVLVRSDIFLKFLSSAERLISTQASLFVEILDCVLCVIVIRYILSKVIRYNYLVIKKQALISVFKKDGIVEFARELTEKYNYEILSTGGTAELLRKNNISVTEVSEKTKFPEMLEGRVKTLHPVIHGG